MKIWLFTLLLLTSPWVAAQHGTAPAGYYPHGYFGDTWTGEVVSVDDTTREITLSYSKKNKIQTFVATLPPEFTVATNQSKQHKLKPSDIPLGTRVIVFYIPKTSKVNGNKVKINEVFIIKTVSQDQKS
jgi:hypothetical protein